jgi:ATP:corrinoid adenosyltransferase
MLQERKTYIYYDKKIEDFSNICTGYLIRSIGEGLNIAYIDCLSKAIKLTSFIENLSLSYSFRKNLYRFHADMFSLKDEKKVSKTIIPQVEFSAITYEMFYNSLNNYDIILIDNYDSLKIPSIKINALLKNKNPKTQIVLCTNKKEDFNLIKENFNYKINCEYKENQGLISKKGLINIYGNFDGKSMYALGYLMRSFISKKDVKLIYFDKGDDIYGDAFFFSQLKKWNIENTMYGNFDFVKTGIKRYKFGNFRDDITFFDIKEAKDGLMLLTTALKKQTPVVADELNDMITKGMLDEQEVINILKNIKNELLITGKNSTSKIKDLSNTILEFKSD